MTVSYGIIFAFSLFLPFGYRLLVKKRQNEAWLLALFIFSCVVDLGYLLLSVSRTVEFALFANKIAYLGHIFMITCMFMIISKICGFTYKPWVKYVLIGMGVLIFSMVLTTGHLDWYYKSVELVEVDGAAKLVKEYGVLHPVYTVYVLAYFAAMLAVIGVSFYRNKNSSQKLAVLMLTVVLGNIGMWLVEKAVPWNFEFLSVSYLMSEIVFLFVYWLLQDYVHVNDVPAVAEEKPSVIFVDSSERKAKVKEILDKLPKGTVLSPRQLDILEGILSGRSRKEIAADLYLSENTVKMHTSALYKALGVGSREEIYTLLK